MSLIRDVHFLWLMFAPSFMMSGHKYIHLWHYTGVKESLLRLPNGFEISEFMQITRKRSRILSFVLLLLFFYCDSVNEFFHVGVSIRNRMR